VRPTPARMAARASTFSTNTAAVVQADIQALRVKSVRISGVLMSTFYNIKTKQNNLR